VVHMHDIRTLVEHYPREQPLEPRMMMDGEVLQADSAASEAIDVQLAVLLDAELRERLVSHG